MLEKVASFHKQRYKRRALPRILFWSFQLAIVVAVALLEPTDKAFTQPFPYSGEPFVPADGFVPDEVTAILIARAVLSPIYGAQIEGEKPYKSRLVNGVWIIKGSLPPNAVGGVFEIWIDKKTGAIIRVSHSA